MLHPSTDRRHRRCSARSAAMLGAAMAVLELSLAPALAADPTRQSSPPTAPSETPQSGPSGAGSSTPPQGNLTKRLERSDGVIAPRQGLDPGMGKPTPELGQQSTPVIPPPGAPGGDPTVQPK